MKARGFTLIELMVVMAILGIVAAIAIPAFTEKRASKEQGQQSTQQYKPAQETK